MDLGSAKRVKAITSWSFHQGGRRGTQKRTLHGSSSNEDPGWNMDALTRIGSVDTAGSQQSTFAAASLRAADGQTLGEFRWIIWSVSPVNAIGGGENTAFQELGVEWEEIEPADFLPSHSDSRLKPKGKDR